MTPTPPRAYTQQWAADITRILRGMQLRSFRSGKDAEIGEGRVILTSPNGTRYAIEVDNAGTLSTTSL